MVKNGLLLFFVLLSGLAVAGNPPANLQLEEAWEVTIDSVFSFSSPRATDLNGDGVRDIVLGSGVENARINLIIALNGVNGEILWTVNGVDEIFGSAIFYDVTGDDIDDVFIHGRSAGLYAVNGSNGALLWKFFNLPGDPIDYGLFNFYQPQLISDVSGDGLMDLVLTNGGDRSISAEEPDRNFGYIMIVASNDGSLILADTLPDNQEVYSNILVYDTDGDDEVEVIYGTGGETDTGSLWLATPDLVLNNSLDQSILLDGPRPKGFIQPSLLVDLTGDGVLDIVSYNLNGTMQLIDGTDYSSLWALEKPGFEFYAAPAICFANADEYPDLAFIAGNGEFDLGYTGFELLIVDGRTGEFSTLDTLGYFLQFNSFVSFDGNGDGISELIGTFNVETPGAIGHQLVYYDLADGSTTLVRDAEPGHNFASTPYLSDIDEDGLAELVYLVNESVPAPPLSLKIMRFDTNIPADGVTWSAYMGENSDNVFLSDISTGIAELQGLPHLKTYPNPARDLVAVEGLQPSAYYRVFDVFGQLVYTGNTRVIDVRDWPDGLYFMMIYEGGLSATAAFVCH